MQYAYSCVYFFLYPTAIDTNSSPRVQITLPLTPKNQNYPHSIFSIFLEKPSNFGIFLKLLPWNIQKKLMPAAHFFFHWNNKPTIYDILEVYLMREHSSD